MNKVSDLVMATVAKHVDTVFFLPGGGCMHLVDSLGTHSGLREVCCLHEQAAVIAADGYAQYRNGLGVALLTTGPGGTNGLTGVAASWIDSTPLLILSGQVKRQDLMGSSGVRQKGIQEVDIVSMASPVTKYAVTVMDPLKIRYCLEKGLYLARNGRCGPVWIDIPLDVQGARVPAWEELEPFIPEPESGPDPAQKTSAVAQTLNLLRQASRPVILAGMGIHLAGADKTFRDLISSLGIPVLATWRYMDQIEDNFPFYFGRPGALASRYANFIVQTCDLLLCIGARLDLPQVGHSYHHLAPFAKKIIIDIDTAELNKINIPVELLLPLDAAQYLSEFEKELRVSDPGLPNWQRWLTQCRKWQSAYPLITEAHLRPMQPVNTYALIDALSRLCSGNDLLVPGSSGSCAEITRQAFRITQGQRMINAPGLGSMGFGLPHAIGVALASGKRVIAIIGDGDLQHNIQELETLRRLHLNVKIFLLNNNGYAAIRNTHRRFFEGRLVGCDPSSGLTLPDSIEIARAYHLAHRKITHQFTLTDDVASVLNMEGPVLCEVLVDPDLEMAPRLASVVRDDGSMESRPLEDLYPFLDRDELTRNMSVGHW